MKTSCFKYYTGEMGVAICLYPPIDWSGLRFPALEPERDIFFAIKNGQITQKEYEKLYRENTLGRLDPQTILNMFDKNVLLCWEDPGEFCHRRIVAKWIEESLGIEVPEWNYKDEKLLQLQQNKNIKPLF
jgi:hypothetical protein